MTRTNDKWDDFKGILWLVTAVLLLPFTFLFLWIPGKIMDAIRVRQYRKRRATTVWQVPVLDEDFLRGCGIEANSKQAEAALRLRRCLADASGYVHKVATEEIAPDMTCGELVHGWNPYMYWHDGFDSVGFEAARNLGKGQIPKETFKWLIQPEKKYRVTMCELFRNYLDVLIPYLQNVPSALPNAQTSTDGAKTETKL